jgi:BASS family bile acid:Na+ symporter
VRILSALVNAFPIWVLIASIIALVEPAIFTWFTGPLITAGLGVIMLGMGVTLEAEDFRRVLRRPGLVSLGVALQFTVMPSFGWLCARVFGLPAPFAVGLILVACCPGGTASNVVSFLARVDVSLSVTMTAVSTLLAVIMTPTLTLLLAGSRIDVPARGLLLSTIQVVILPVVAGLLLKRFAPRVSARIMPVAPLVAVLAITLIVASIIGAGRQQILQAGWSLVLAVFSLHTGGFLVGYGVSRLIATEIPARTVSIEVGMQNSGLGVVLARQNFADPLVAIPSAISSLFHSLIASALAGLWRRSSASIGTAIAPGAAEVPSWPTDHPAH